jgi:hypothetical protein
MAKRTYTYDGSEWVGLTSPAVSLDNYPNMTTTPISGFRNVIINGDFRINQRAFASTTSDNTYGFDRWNLTRNDGTTTYSAQTFTPGNAISGYEPINFARLVTSGQTAAGAYSILQQRIEDVRTFAGQTITVSFWAKSGSGTPTVAIEMEQVFGSGGSPSSAVLSLASKITLSTSWARYTATIIVPSISGKTIGTTANTSYLQLNIWVSNGSTYTTRTTMGIQSNTFDFWGVQVEAGTTPTPLEQRPIGLETTLCHRYFQRFIDPAGFGVNAGGNATRVLMPLYTRMRAIPTTVISGTFNFWNGGGTGTSTALQAAYNSISHGQLDFLGGAGTTGQPNALYTNGGSNYADFSAEL